MTHDELVKELHYLSLADTYNLSTKDNKFDIVLKGYRTLLAVVELHTPREEVTGINDRGDVLSSQTICNFCTGLGAFSTKYPCPTIKSIEKELG